MNNYLLVISHFSEPYHHGHVEQRWFTVCAYTEEAADVMGDKIAQVLHENDTDKQWTSIIACEL